MECRFSSLPALDFSLEKGHGRLSPTSVPLCSSVSPSEYFLFFKGIREIESSSYPSKIWGLEQIHLSLNRIFYFPIIDRNYLCLMLCHSRRTLLLPSFFKGELPG